MEIEHVQGIIHELETLLPDSSDSNFRERFVAHLETLEQKPSWDDTDLEFRLKADALLSFYEQIFGVNDLVEKPYG